MLPVQDPCVNIFYVIPAYNPDAALLGIVKELAALPSRGIIVVNDGSSPDKAPLFEEVASLADRVTVLRHAVNLGKGAALKTAFNHVLLLDNGAGGAGGVVTLDADGQHLAQDCARVAQALCEHPAELVLGAREFKAGVPLRSRFGNIVTRHIFWGLLGQKLGDTQSGLRGIPTQLLRKLMRVQTTGYDFELDMLVECRLGNIPIHQVPIQTVYLDGNITSHFNPLFDSVKIYLVFLRFLASSLLSTAIDYTVFSLAFASLGNILLCQYLARFTAGAVNCGVNYKYVFKSNRKVRTSVILYVSLLVVMGLVSYGMILLLQNYLGMNVYMAKLLSEFILYFVNFVVQRDLVFRRSDLLLE